MGGSPNVGGTQDVGMAGQDVNRIRKNADSQSSIGDTLKGISNSQDVTSLAGQGLTQSEQMQIGLVDQGKQGAVQSVRDNATARGMFSSGDALTQEGLIPMQLAQQKADIYGQAQQRQFQGLGLQQGLLGTAGGMYGNANSSINTMANNDLQSQQWNNENALNKYKLNNQNMMGAGQLGTGILQAAPAALAMFSDKRLKKDIKTIDNAIDKIKKINGVSFTWKDTDEKDLGVIAQTIEKTFPELIHLDIESGYKKVNYSGLIGVLIEAVKELSQKLEEKTNG